MSEVPLAAGLLEDRRTRTVPSDEAWPGRLARSVRIHWRVTDPKVVSLLVFTALASGIVGGGLHTPARLVQIAIALALSSMGARAVSNYIDRDIDAVMDRTRRRPLPSVALPPAQALILGLGLILAGLLLSLPFGRVVVLMMALGLADNLIVYSLLTKRTTPLSIVLGAPSGGAPALVGYVAMAGRIDLTALLLATFVMLWTPIHIWSLAIRYREDYARANVPMLPVVAGVRPCARCIGYASATLAVCTVLFVVAERSRVLVPVSVTLVALAGALLVSSLWLVRTPTGEHAWTLFKFTSPYLALLFASLALNAVFAR